MHTPNLNPPAASHFVADWNPDEYNAAMLRFHEQLPRTLSDDLPDAVYNAVAYSMANPTITASHEYMLAFFNSMASAPAFPAPNAAAMANITPEIEAWADFQFFHPTFYSDLLGMNINYLDKIEDAVEVAVIGQFGDWGSMWPAG